MSSAQRSKLQHFRMPWLGLALPLLAAGAVFFAGRTDPIQQPQAALPDPIKPERAPAQAALDERPVAPPRPTCFVGVLVSRGAVDVSARSAGILGPIDFGVGDRVRRGQELARVESLPSRHRLSEEKASTEAADTAARAAEAELRQARRELERRQGTPELFSTEQIEAAAYQVEVAELNHRSRRSALAQAESVRARVQSEADDAILRSPFDGKISAIFAVENTRVEPGQPILRLLGNEQVVRFAVPANDRDLFALGTRIDVGLKGSDVSAINAVVHEIAPALDSASQLIFLEATITAPLWAEASVGARLWVTPEGGVCHDQKLALFPDGGGR